MYKKLLFIGIFFCMNFAWSFQEKLTWNDLTDVTFKPSYNVIYETEFLMPTFGDKVRSLEGKKVRIKGYFLDISGDKEFLLLSSRPMAMCFFCGGSGPETIMELDFKKRPSFNTDQIIEVTGTLQLNSYDVEHCNYILTDVKATLAD